MNTHVNVTPILEAIVSICVILITRYIIPWLKAKAGAGRVAQITELAEIAVRAAEKMYDTNQEKRAYALDYIHKKGYDLNADEMRMFIEAAVHKIKSAAQDAQALDAAED